MNPSTMNTADIDNDANTNSSTNSEFRNFIADIEDLVKATTSQTGENLDAAKAALSARVEAAKKSADVMGDAIAEQARTTAKVTNNFVHEHPWQSVGIGAALGLLIGIAFAGKK